ncbi:MAG TPA: hypothetical protein VKH19_06230, partial [Gemmatimonadaceae bacterium]|nr:hypothetical protein [Gemmatimonadaceae bacterium]
MRRHRLVAPLTLVALAGCSTRATPRRVEVTPASDRIVRVALPSAGAQVSATGDFSWFAGDGVTLMARARRGERWSVEMDSARTRVRAKRPGGEPLGWQSGMIVRATGESFLTHGGKRYRGELGFVARDTGLLAVNRVDIEAYLRGVVPLEMGARPRGDSSALQA